MARLLLSLVLLLSTACMRIPECGSYVEDGEAVDGTMCPERLERTLSVSSALGEETLQRAIEAGEMWKVATANRVNLSWVVTDAPDADVFPMSQAEQDSSTLWGRTGAYSGRIRLRTTVRGDDLRATIAHELGHTFGLGHDAPGHLMYSDVDTSSYAITPADVLHFDRLWQAMP